MLWPTQLNWERTGFTRFPTDGNWSHEWGCLETTFFTIQRTVFQQRRSTWLTKLVSCCHGDVLPAGPRGIWMIPAGFLLPRCNDCPFCKLLNILPILLTVDNHSVPEGRWFICQFLQDQWTFRTTPLALLAPADESRSDWSGPIVQPASRGGSVD